MSLRAKRGYIRQPLKEVRAQFLAIYQRMNPGKDSPAQVFGRDFWKYLDIYCRLRLRFHAEIVDAIATSFAATCERKNKEKRALEEVIVAQRKRLAELERPQEKQAAGPYVPPADHSRRAETPPQPIPSNPEHGGHSWTDYKGLPVCGICGIVKRAEGTNKPCKGPVFVEPRDCPQRPWSSSAEGTWEGTGVPRTNERLREIVEEMWELAAVMLNCNIYMEDNFSTPPRMIECDDSLAKTCKGAKTSLRKLRDEALGIETQQEHGCNAPSGEGIADRDPATPEGTRWFHEHRRSTDNPSEKTLHIRQTERQASPEPRPAPPPLDKKSCDRCSTVSRFVYHRDGCPKK
jgi:hypothetical protein